MTRYRLYVNVCGGPFESLHTEDKPALSWDELLWVISRVTPKGRRRSGYYFVREAGESS